uniref:NADH-ubiquinone oxidoreductase chain 1 n=1 Tax=Bursaphelenchus xylophilus TaxID=6326 RepID=H9D1N3_BURXY|nr:NADH dehydrogenase subunit 1 [Bursaphelenchus xylophilus]ACV96740.1 NADH dehydrogenase subunit 1 [Bursaphelenchus xylophilus]AFC69030.1 NADH dehydrogenase subunit 1 [Bursaphelenchus xylophilus]AFC69042.1 NADH dehydrogenase subunit 1 [Bursaphelenchus xylophilus]AFC69054.1 NADH dehydrogenase subunit 1 [Bursaphelenchus xylophilus]BAV78622.1 NADH dehydrogenase subunit 1 [Bursaphelenchus xylophilus]
MLMSFLMSLVFVLFIILSIAFITLYERHLLGLSQNRLGPNKVFFLGILQAGLDGVKLMSKEQVLPKNSSDIYFLFIPGVSFFFMFLEWSTLPFLFNFINFQFSFLFLLCLVGVTVYFVIISGLMSNSKYSFLGAIRSSSQSVSFEIAFSLYLLSFMLFLNSFDFVPIFNFLLFYIFYPFLLMVLAELARAPFDFSEGESELVSGFNTEHSSISFVFLFLGEYGVLIFFSVVASVFFFYFNFLFVFFYFTLLLLIRSAFPRFRYDMLMDLFWKVILPLSLLFLIFYWIILY